MLAKHATTRKSRKHVTDLKVAQRPLRNPQKHVILCAWVWETSQILKKTKNSTF